MSELRTQIAKEIEAAIAECNKYAVDFVASIVADRLVERFEQAGWLDPDDETFVAAADLALVDDTNHAADGWVPVWRWREPQ